MDCSEKLRKNEGKHIPYVKCIDILSLYRNLHRWKWVINDIFCLDDYVLTYFDEQMHFYYPTGNKIVGANLTMKFDSFKRNLISHKNAFYITPICMQKLYLVHRE